MLPLPGLGITVTPESRQTTYLLNALAAVKGGKFITTTSGGQPDPTASGDVVNRTPPSDGHIASAGNLLALALDGATDAFGNPWHKSNVRSGDTFSPTVQFGGSVKVRRVTVYSTKANWDPQQPLTRAQFDLTNPLYARTYTCAPYQACNDEIPVGLVASEPISIGFNLPQRPVGHHVLLMEIDHPDTTDATYQVIDLNYIG
ncbi:lytic polysaccharide monooxygenase [Streptomyces goshikiensis]|uniref:lytic polysaccharide monooxygenase n=1 Tax=Streptomyces goshikiensis TaxID=1942 RepID=UPI003677CD75